MAASTNIKSGGLVTLTVKVEDAVVSDQFPVKSIEIENRANRIPKARIEILDGDVSSGKFEASSSSSFKPGNEITIEAGYDSKNEILFKGIITNQTLRINNSVRSELVVECRDKAVKMIVGRKSLSYSKKKDSEIITSIIGNYSGLSADVTSTSATWDEQVQYDTTDWDFVLSRAEANGLIVTVLNGKISIQKPDAQTSPVLEIKYGQNLIEFNADINAVTQLTEAKASSWDYQNQEIVTGEASNSYAGPGNLSSSELAEVVKLSDYQLKTSGSLQESDLTNWSKAQLVKSSFSKIQGEVRFQGTELVNAGHFITLSGVGERFSGDYLVSGVVHNISMGNWTTEAVLGLTPVWFSNEPDIMSPPAAGLLPGVRGLFNATVKKIYEDPNSQYRILVDVPLFDQGGEGIWARLTNFYSTNGAGVFFLPEVGDEVIIGFLNEDPRYPIILGSVYSSTKIKPFEGLEPNEKNSKKAIVSKSGIYLEFDDEDKILTITTPAKNKVICSDKDKQITVQDQNNNSIVMSESGITIKSEKDINIDAGQNLTLKGNQGVSIESATGDVSTSGMNVKVQADTQYSVEGGETAQINSSIELSLNSEMIMIN